MGGLEGQRLKEDSYFPIGASIGKGVKVKLNGWRLYWMGTINTDEIAETSRGQAEVFDVIVGAEVIDPKEPT